MEGGRDRAGSVYEVDVDDKAWRKAGEADASATEEEGAPPQSDAASGQATDQFGLELSAAIEKGINFFRERNDNSEVVNLYAKIKKEGNAYSNEKKSLTDWMRNVRNKMKAIHA